MLDLKICGGTVVDGTGAPRKNADIGIKDGRIVAVGDVPEPSRETIDATGRIVSPGFVDSHTHYDAQVFWDPKITPSCFHGVTTVIGGFCGFSIAPITPESAAYIKPMLARVEGMPLETLEKYVPWNWSSFREFLAQIDGRVGLNVGFFAGHSAIRRIAMGSRAVGEKSTPAELEVMKELLNAALSQGALGFSTSTAPTHHDGDGNPVPSRWADHSEIVELAREVDKHPGTGLEIVPNIEFAPDVADLMVDMSVAGNRPINWNVLAITGRPNSDEMVARQLEVSNYARTRGGEVIALTIPGSLDLYMTLEAGVTFDALPGIWGSIFKCPIAERITKFKDPEVRQQMAADAASMSPTAGLEAIARLGDYTVVTVVAEKNKKYEDRKLKDIATDEKRAVIDVMLDIAVDDALRTTFRPDMGGYDRAAYEKRATLWQDDRTLIGGSDAGAHLDMIDTFGFTTMLLEKGVREHRLIELEDAISKITKRPAEYFGLVDRGIIEPGYHADIVIFDENSIAQGAVTTRRDLPGGDNFRIHREAIGIEYVIVNGVTILRNGEHTGALPGAVLRSGIDTRTVALDALRH